MDDKRQTPFDLYCERQPLNTTRTIRSNIKSFCDFLCSAYQIERSIDDLVGCGHGWKFITVEIYEEYRQWLMDQKYAPNTIKLKLSCVKRHIALAVKTGDVERTVYATIKGTSGSAGKQYQGRMSGKKSAYDALSVDQAHLLKTDHPATPQGARDKLMLCLCLDLGMRPSEVENLLVSDVDMRHRTIRVRRTKYIVEQIHKMSGDIYLAMSEYFECAGAPRKGRLIRATRKNKQLDGDKFSSANIQKRIKHLGEVILNKDDLTPGDLRKTFAVHAKRAGSDLAVIRKAGGWKTAVMPERYVDEQKTDFPANDGLRLPRQTKD